MTDDAKPEPQVRVIDRRWWARGEDSGGTAATTKPTYVEELERQLADKSAKLQRVSDEFEQVKLRLRRDAGREVERERRAVLVELLDVLDNLDRAIGAGAPDNAASALLRGVELVREQFRAKLQGFGVQPIVALGQPFDAAVHEAVSTAAVEHAAQDGVVVAVVKEGYAIGGDLLRPASVVVGRHGE